MWLPQIEYWWQLPAVGKITAALEEIYGRSWRNAETKNALGVKFVADLYDYDVVWEQHWLPTLEHIEKSLW